MSMNLMNLMEDTRKKKITTLSMFSRNDNALQDTGLSMMINSGKHKSDGVDYSKKLPSESNLQTL